MKRGMGGKRVRWRWRKRSERGREREGERESERNERVVLLSSDVGMLLKTLR